MDTFILMLIVVVVASLIIVFGIDAVILTHLIKFFKVKNASFKKSLVIVLIFTLVGFFVNTLLRLINLSVISNIFPIIIGFLVFYYLLKKYHQIGWKISLLIYIIWFGAISIMSFLIVIPTRQYIAQPFYVSGDSMSPNYNSNDYLLLNMFDRKFIRGDVVIYSLAEDSNQFYIKRIVGLPGEVISIQKGRVAISGQNLSEPYINEATSTNINLTLGSNEYFVLGDNRGRSFDSRFHGPIKNSEIIGKVIYNFSSQK